MRLPVPEFGPPQRISPLWSSATTAGPPEPEPIRCQHCDVPIRRWTNWWIHCGPRGTLQCRGDHGLLHDDRYATPAVPPAPPAA